MVALHAVDFWLSSEDLPHPENRVTIDDGRVRLTLDSEEQHRGAQAAAQEVRVDARPTSGCTRACTTASCTSTWAMDIAATAHQAGTVRFGTDPATSVLDVNCKAHELDNLYVVDSGFFASIGAVNPTLTIIANALRVGDHLLERLGA